MNPTYQTVLTNSNSLPSQNFKPIRTVKRIKKSTDSKARVKFHAHFPPGRNKTLPISFSHINKLITVSFPPSPVVIRTSIGNICSFISSKCSQLCNLIGNSKELTPKSGIWTVPTWSCVLPTGRIASGQQMWGYYKCSVTANNSYFRRG